MAYSGDLTDPAEKLYTLDYYLGLAEQIVESGAHILAVKDMAGLLRPAAAKKLVTALRKEFDLPVHVHTHDTAGGQLATYLAAADAGADAVDGASAPMSGTTSQPSLSAIVAAFAHTYRDTGISLDAVGDLEPYWEAVRNLYAPFESGIPGPPGGSTTTRSRVASCRTCAPRPRRWAWRTASSSSKTPTRMSTSCWGAPPRSPRRPRWSATWRSTWWAPA